MRNSNSSGLRSSIAAVAAVAVTGLTLYLFESPYTAWGQYTQPPSEEVALSVPANDHELRNV